MKIGICRTDDIYDAAVRCGLDYVEPAMCAIRDKQDSELREMRRRAEDKGLTLDGTNGFFGGDVRLYDDDKAVCDYAARNFEAANIIGASYCVIGSGTARAVPEGGDKQVYLERFAGIIYNVGNVALQYGVEVYIEHLRKEESNIINTFDEAVRFCRGVGLSNVGCLLDLFHFYSSGEDLAELDKLAPGELKHVHIARPNPDRFAPRAEDEKAIKEWTDKLKMIGYDGRLSLECRWDSFETELAEGVSVIRRHI